ncbi:MBL fold metallo-hydrolase [Pelomonas sp. V22]|uniref:MBL fold metallo-hydrolase n=1 Tax=Pelomonas sp. V22 TaxID=2822139 RepID=UPI0024A8D75B|nr:MBL fold metallo-hydrolase [Pelomonas sp. V22]MDI4632241.1 MBL fold metallo-hydrolase [Pelomonas sp. V22]
MRGVIIAIALFLGIAVPGSFAAAAAAPAQVQALKITILSTMVADYGTRGEWGFSALVEADGRKLLVDTGLAPGTVLENAKALGIDLSDVKEVVLTHNHDDHTGGLLSLREALRAKNPRAMSRVHLASAAFASRPHSGAESNYLLQHRAEMEKLGIQFIAHDEPVELLPGLWFSGPVPRKFPERNWSGSGKLVLHGETMEDTIPEDSAIAINTAKGTVLLSGCGHAGVVNTMAYSQERVVPGRPIVALVGGFHLFQLKDERLEWTGRQMQAFGVKWLLGAHCTGFEAVYRLRQQLRLPREAALVAAIGSRYSLKDGITPDESGLTR